MVVDVASPPPNPRLNPDGFGVPERDMSGYRLKFWYRAVKESSARVVVESGEGTWWNIRTASALILVRMAISIKLSEVLIGFGALAG